MTPLRAYLMVLAQVLFALALILWSQWAAYGTENRVCLSNPGKGYHSYRLIDGRKCWFYGDSVIPKNQLRWAEPKSKPVKRDSPERVPVPPLRDNSPGSFDVRWLTIQQELAVPPKMLSPEPLAGSKLCDYIRPC